MAKPKYKLNPGEIIILKESSVKHGFGGSFIDELILTNQSIIWVSYGFLGNLKEIVRYPLSEVSQAIIGKAQNGSRILEVYFNGMMEDFTFQSDRDRKLLIWSRAIADRFKENNEGYDFHYYQRLYDESSDLTKENLKDQDYRDSQGYNSRFIGDVASSVIKSGNFSVPGVLKGLSKASKKQSQRSATKGIIQGLKDEMGFEELEDEFIEIGNEFRGMIGIKPKLTKSQLKMQKLNAAFDRQDAINNQGMTVEQTSNQSAKPQSVDMSIGEQIETLKKLKDLLNAGILTKDEFEAKKKEILKL